VAKIIIASRIPLAKLSGNPHFPNPPFPIHELENELSYLEELKSAFKGGMRNLKSLRDATLKSFIYKMTILSNHVTTVAQGDVEKLTSSGFEFYKTPTPATEPPKIHRISAANSPLSGVARVWWSGFMGKKFYRLQTTTTPSVEASWKQVDVLTAVNCEVHDLEVGKFAYFRVCAVNAAGDGPWSHAAKVMVS